ncbi:hypothetical protein AMIS_19650 [Actinoplanes missouriensis 431]|uniref:Uncharacterized protein n=1 Tax=Actinoplanes missouriensis (strain ATCC 14538 / DSM 43046 / CBS 188.64 / JCM 3121 / NBRC 102363 / NCIMB 12654 / NRRL B-3342 / UNCC 431) TaxID=512565 RepID=I0H2E8_ACTM4|nr:hypothetical protein [Actinoplanes missouriensis]BAL87185.1 hypothetical protein AMIS_19650 [Actinoplanes missouriensis 431]
MPTYTFEELKRSQTFKLKCACGKRFQRTIAETQTVNPFNKNQDGTVKTRTEVWQSVGEKLREAIDRFTPTCPAGHPADDVTIVSQWGSFQ